MLTHNLHDTSNTGVRVGGGGGGGIGHITIGPSVPNS
jgi:hypothetical protein